MLAKLLVGYILVLAVLVAQTAPLDKRTTFHVKYVGAGALYIDGGSAHGLAEGMALDIVRHAPGAAQLDIKRIGRAVILAVATQSAVCELRDAPLGALVGDEARLSAQDAESRERMEIAQGRRHYAQVISFTSGDPMDEEVRKYIPHPPLTEEGHFRGRIGIEYSSIADHSASGTTSNQTGGVIRADWTRINHSYWSLTGYWRGRWNTSNSSRQQTLFDQTNRTYQMALLYNNPQSRWEFGLGRILLPWATSLNTIDGGYAVRRLTKDVRVGVFGGSTPDPTLWNYDPNRELLGVFLNAQKGSFESVHWSGTVGAAVTRVHWRPERQFAFFENNFSLGQKFSVFHNLEADMKNPLLMNGDTGAQISRSFLTVRYQPHKRISFDVSHNYFRGIPTFDQSLIGLGLLDKLLFTGLSFGVRVEPIDHLILSADFGKSSREGDVKQSLNQGYDVAYTRLPYIHARIDGRYMKYASSFGNGSYESVTLSKDLRESMRIDLLAGQQDIQSLLSAQSRSRFIGAQFDFMFGGAYFLTGGWTTYRGQVQNYDQLYITVGYRFR